jgi:formylglycine-generating enzyme required for sulfatase activity
MTSNPPSELETQLGDLRAALARLETHPAGTTTLVAKFNALITALEEQQQSIESGGAYIAGDAHAQTFIGRDQLNIGLQAKEVADLLARFAPTAADPRQSEQAYLDGLLLRINARRLEKLFVPLAGYLTEIALSLSYRQIEGEGASRRIRHEKLDDIREAARRYPQLVVLGEPGAGKTTVLEILAMEAARARLRDAAAPLPLLVLLAEHRDRSLPFDFLAHKWQQLIGPGGFADALRRGELLIIADALNQMPRDQFAERVAAWQLFAHEQRGGANRMIFASRTRDYVDELEGVQQVEIERLDNLRIEEFLRKALPQSEANALWEMLSKRNPALLALARNPYLLQILADGYQPGQPPPANRGQLFATFTARLFRREQARAHPHWIEAHAQSAALARLAFAMQSEGQGTSLSHAEMLRRLPAQVRIGGKDAPTPPDAIVELGVNASLLDVSAEGRYSFYHQWLQEFFAAQELLRRLAVGDAGQVYWRAPQRKGEMPPLRRRKDDWEPLPPAPPTGWEETTIMAAGIADDAPGLLEALRKLNPVLAARCIGEGGAAAPPELHAAIRQQLVDALAAAGVHLRARLAAGSALGQIGDSRFVKAQREGQRYVEPPLVRVPAGSFPMGSAWWDRQRYDDERPQHQVRLPEYWIGRYPVTDAEFACFVDGGGYGDEQYWRTEDARRWLRGELGSGGRLDEVLDLRRTLDKNPKLIDEWVGQQRMRPEEAQTWRTLVRMSEEEARAKFGEALERRSRTEPAYWNDSRFNQPNLPVVGVTWFEARAYAAWLSVCTGKTYRLPTEAEWEKAARGKRGRLHPWGYRWDAAKCNTLEGRILGTSPVGAFPEGTSPYGAMDMAGNVWEWTGTLYQPYPYVNDVSRENAESEGKRVLRGGSWFNGQVGGSLAARLAPSPFRSTSTTIFGFRVVCVPG